MLDESLNLQRGLQDIGELQEAREFSFKRDERLVVLSKQLKGIEKSGNPETEFKGLIDEFLRLWHASPLFQYLKRNLPPETFDEEGGGVEENVLELLYNAWDHVGDSESQEDVRVHVYLGKNRQILINVEQAGEGFDYKGTIASMQKDGRVEQRSDGGGGMARIDFSDASFGYEHVVEGEKKKFRSLLLQSLQPK